MILCPPSTEPAPRGKQCQRLQAAKMSASDKERTPQLLFVKALASRGRLEAIAQQMGYHPQYLDSFLRMQHYLLHMDGPLPFDCRHYIAIMAAARHRCRYLVNLHVLQFLRVGGDPLWLRGLDYIPPKLRKLSEINKILAHRPWLVGKEHIESLDSCVELESLRERIHRLQVESEAREELRPPDRDEGPDGAISGAVDLSCYVQDPNFGYQDFAQCDEDQPQIFRVQDYSWEDHGFSLVNRLYSDIGHLLDEKFRKVDGLQSCSMAKRQGCEHATFKRGIWNYIHCMFGIRYDDYDYAEVNHFLERILKLYIKTVTCSPEKMNPEMFERFWKQFKHSEKVHVNLLILEARLQAELLYALRAITHYMVS
ncbi:sestrin-3-like isoform X2 [Elgaria multicarinata webbii]|uniref:sestrin-3-like isoform X2 n=1 Tax=Elgaria multicarinata webbii TaxID=159646 RepID=UPI002FCCE5F0